MKYAKRAVSCGIVTAALIVTAVASTLSGNVTDTSQSSQQVYKEVVILAESDNVATKQKAKAERTIEATTLAVSTNIAMAVAGEAADAAWAGMLMADIDDALNVRAEASENADVVGKLYKESLAEVIEKGDEWTKIKSGNVEGYVRTKYCVFGDDAKALAEEVCKKQAVSKVEGLQIRANADLEETTQILYTMEEGEKGTVVTNQEVPSGWVVIACEDTVGYVSAEQVAVTYVFAPAMTLEEEKEAELAKEKARYEAIAASAKIDATVTVDDVKLLAALIFCEAGGERYEGQVAVGAVVMNRIESSRFPDSIYSVTYQKGQFTPAMNGKVQRTLDNGKYKYCLDAAEAALQGEDPTNGCLYFNSGRGKGMQIGNQHFY